MKNIAFIRDHLNFISLRLVIGIVLRYFLSDGEGEAGGGGAGLGEREIATVHVYGSQCSTKCVHVELGFSVSNYDHFPCKMTFYITNVYTVTESVI